MNERIKQLADKCGLTIDNNSPDATWKELEFFAEQIVQECADHINSSSDRYRREYFADKILTHFGIKQ
jgi:DNA primase